jgi:hypothetical protein
MLINAYVPRPKMAGPKPISDQQRMDPWHIIAWLPTITTTDSRIAHIEPMLLAKGANGTIARGVNEPISTIAAKGAGALIAPYYGEGSGQTGQAVEEPVPTVTTKGRL